MEEGPEMEEKKREERRDQTMNNTQCGTWEIGGAWMGICAVGGGLMINPAEVSQRS